MRAHLAQCEWTQASSCLTYSMLLCNVKICPAGACNHGEKTDKHYFGKLSGNKILPRCLWVGKYNPNFFCEAPWQRPSLSPLCVVDSLRSAPPGYCLQHSKSPSRHQKAIYKNQVESILHFCLYSSIGNMQ